MKNYVKYQNTSNQIKNTLLQLLKAKPINQISVQEICQILHINRSTFYRHYEDLYDLYKEIEEDFLEKLKDFYTTLSSEKQTSFEAMTDILSFIKKNREMYHLLMVEQRDDHFFEQFNEINSSVFLYKIQQKYPNSRNTSLDEIKQTVLFISSGFYTIYKDWIISNCTQPIDSLAKKLSTLSDLCIEETLKNK